MSASDNTVIRGELVETDDSGAQQTLKVLGRDAEQLGEKQKVIHIQGFGLTAHAPKGSLGAVIVIGGNPDQAMVLDLEHPDKRPKNLAEGEAKVYNARGDNLHLKADGTVILTCKTFKVVAEVEIVLETPIVYAGAKAGAKDVAFEGTVTSDGATLVSNFATRLKAV